MPVFSAWHLLGFMAADLHRKLWAHWVIFTQKRSTTGVIRCHSSYNVVHFFLCMTSRQHKGMPYTSNKKNHRCNKTVRTNVANWPENTTSVNFSTAFAA